MAEERGIEEVKDILDFMFSFIEAVGKARTDGEMSWGDARYFIDPVKNLFDDVEDIEKQDRKFHVKIIDFIKENKDLIILGVIMITISLLHSEIYMLIWKLKKYFNITF